MSYCECGGYIGVIQVSSVSYQATCGKCNVSGVVMGSIEAAKKSQKFRKDLHAPMTSEELIDAMKTVKGFADPTHASDAIRYADLTMKPLSHPGGLNWKPQMKVNDAFTTEDGNTWVITNKGPVMMGELGSEFIMPQWPQPAIDNDEEMSVDVVELLEKI